MLSVSEPLETVPPVVRMVAETAENGLLLYGFSRAENRKETRRKMDDEISPEGGAQDKLESALDLNFVPTWARKPPENPYVGRENSGTWESGRERSGSRNSRSGSGRQDRDERRGGRSSTGNRPGGVSSGQQARPRGQTAFGGPGRPGPRTGPREGSAGFSPRPGGQRGPRQEDSLRDGERGRFPRRESRPRLDVRVTFLPDRECLALVVRDIQASRRAFPLAEIASRFLSREDLYLVKLELPLPAAGEERQTFVQCLECKRVFRSRSNAEAHVLQDHLDKFFSMEQTEVEPPAGIFNCVARCGLSGTLLGPPNYHGYNEKIQELWSSRFAQMSKADYLAHIQTQRDEALVEQWKDSVRKKTIYRLKDVPEGQDAAAMTRAEAQDWMQSKVKPMLRESARSIVPGPQSRQFDDGALRAAVSAAWQRESRFPLTLLLALRPAFRHMRLHLFKVNAKETFVTAVPPVPVDAAAAPEIVREIVAFLEAHPGIPRQQVLDQLRPGEDPESTKAAELLLHLGNLVATGGVIEFFDGALALPRNVAVRPAGAATHPARTPKKAARGGTAKKRPAGKSAAGSASPEGLASAEDIPTTEDIPVAEKIAESDNTAAVLTNSSTPAPATTLAKADAEEAVPSVAIGEQTADASPEPEKAE